METGSPGVQQNAPIRELKEIEQMKGLREDIIQAVDEIFLYIYTEIKQLFS